LLFQRAVALAAKYAVGGIMDASETKSDTKDSSEKQETDPVAPPKEGETAAKPTREIKGNLPYTASPGSIKSVLDALIKAERPDKLSTNYMETVFGLSGGGVRSVPPILKKMGFLQSDATPTELYSKFKTDSGRGQAALAGLKQAFPEIFRKNEVAHRANEDQIRDIIIEITGLKKADPILRHIINTFAAIKAYVPDTFAEPAPSVERVIEPVQIAKNDMSVDRVRSPIGLSYQINIVLPESQDPVVYDAIFRSLKRNLLE
jgi:Family of unknown function (DUF5343)